jgi:hypothetical protein
VGDGCDENRDVSTGISEEAAVRLQLTR